MTGLTRLSLNLLLVMLFSCGCSREVPPEPASQGEASPGATAQLKPKNATSDVSGEKREPSDPAVPIDQAMKKSRLRPVVVGGCGEDCSDHKESIRKYFQSLTDKEASGRDVSFLETSEMVFNGERLGDRWVQLWKDGKFKQRSDEIQAFAKKAGHWASDLSPEEMERLVAGAISYGEDDEPGYLIYFRHPPIEGDDSLPVWRYRVQARGWEWLISGIRTKDAL